MDNDTFGQMPAFPTPAIYDPQREQVNSAYQYGCEMGLNVRQLVWLQIYTSVLADTNTNHRNAATVANEGLVVALVSLKELA